MLRPSYLANCANNLEAMYSQLEADITADIARRVAKHGKYTDTSQWQAMKLREATAAYQMYLKYVKNASKYAREEVRTALIDGSRAALNTDNRIYRAAGLHPANIAGSQALMDIIMAGAQKTNGVLSNMTMTTARDATWTLQQALDRVYVQVESGAYDFDSAMRSVIKDLGQKGYTHFKYDSGTKTSLEAASRRALITGLNQTVATLQLERANELETDLVEVSSHAGARPTHAEWQGQVYSLSGNHPHYDNFYDATEYGFGDGLCGWNCYHSFYPYVEGVSTPSFDRDPAHELGMSNDELYELTQDQRYLERQVRVSRRECQTLDAAMSAADEELADQLRSEFSKAAVLLKKREAKLQQFCKQNGLPYDASRVTTFNFGRSTSAKAVWANRKAAELTVNSKAATMEPKRAMAGGLRAPITELTMAQRQFVRNEIAAIGGDMSHFSFTGWESGTRYDDDDDVVYIAGNVFPDERSTKARDRMSVRATLAHEYYGHRSFRGTKARPGSWNDEFRASYTAALKAPGLTDDDRQLLMRDALDRASEAGVTIKYNDEIRRILYGR